MFKKCPECGSIWVCWNWFSLPDNIWGHECWRCCNTFETNGKVTTGIPYWILSWLSPDFPHDGISGKFERKMTLYDYFPFTIPTRFKYKGLK